MTNDLTTNSATVTQKSAKLRERRNQLRSDSEFRGRYLNILPGDELVFDQKAMDKDLSDYIHLTNTTASFVAFKVKTTTPEKFRVKPSFGCIEAGSSRSVEISLQPGFLLTAQKDKFLVMSTPLDAAPGSQSELLECWHNRQRDEASEDFVEEHRLRCSVIPPPADSKSESEGLPAKIDTSAATVPPPILEKIDQINAKIDKLVALHNATPSQLLKNQWNLMSIGIAIAVLYIGFHIIQSVFG